MDGKGLPRLTLAGLFIVIAVQIGGFALLWSKDALPPEYVYLPTTADKTVTDSPVNTPVVVVAPPDEKALRRIIQAVLEQELATYARESTSASGTPPAIVQTNSAGAKENSSENIQAMTSVTSVISNAVAQGKWTATDYAAILPHIDQLTSEQRYKIMNEMANAINRQELELEIPFPLL
jgi:hypothetical protein